MFGRGTNRLCWAPRRLCLWMELVLWNLRFLDLKKVEITEEMMCARTQLQFQMPIQSGRSFQGAKFNNTSRNNQ